MTLIDLGLAGAGEPVPLADVKSYCRIDQGEEDGLVARLLAAARRTIEAETGLALARRAFRLCLDAVPAGGLLRLPRRPLDAVLSVTAFDGEGAPTLFPGETGIAARHAGGAALRLSPDVAGKGANGVEVEFRAGFLPDEVPAELHLALLQVVAASYDWRGGVDMAMQPAAVPASARALVAPFREVWL